MTHDDIDRSRLGTTARAALDAVLLHIDGNSLPLPVEHAQDDGSIVLDFVAKSGVLSLLFHDDWVQFAAVGKSIEGRTKVTIEPGKEWKIVDRFNLEVYVLNEIGGSK